MRIQTRLLDGLTVGRFSRMRESIDLDPPYQREGGIWDDETRRRLIDSIINGLDVPKLYFERAMTRRINREGLTYQYSVIDGKQRLGAINSYLNDELRLPEDFILFEDESRQAAGHTLSELRREFPGLATRFLDYELPVVSVVTESGDLIEEMFQRLNAASSLNAAERRNAISGSTKDAANALAGHVFLIKKSPIKNARYKYRELGAKFLAIEQQVESRGKIVDTKAETLLRLFKDTHDKPVRITDGQMEAYRDRATDVLDHMAGLFQDNDPLLSSIGTVVVYYLSFRNEVFRKAATREALQSFEVLRREAARMSDNDPAYGSPVNARLRDYNLLVQSTNDGRALDRRATILAAYVVDGLAGLEHLDEQDIAVEVD